MKIGFVAICWLFYLALSVLGAGAYAAVGLVRGSYPEVEPIMLWSFVGAGLTISAAYLSERSRRF